jgi:hypothetical protein
LLGPPLLAISPIVTERPELPDLVQVSRTEVTPEPRKSELSSRHQRRSSGTRENVDRRLRAPEIEAQLDHQIRAAGVWQGFQGETAAGGLCGGLRWMGDEG